LRFAARVTLRSRNGEPEEIVGKALKGRRDNIVLATKVHGAMGEDPNQQGSSYLWITQAVEASLRRLQTDHIDLYQMHWPSPDTDIEETLSVLTDLMREERCAPSGHRPSPLPRSWRRNGGAPGPGSLSHRAAALFDPQPQHRAGGSARLPEVWGGRAGLESAGEGHSATAPYSDLTDSRISSAM
jgi:hypothetical protein